MWFNLHEDADKLPPELFVESSPPSQPLSGGLQQQSGGHSLQSPAIQAESQWDFMSIASSGGATSDTSSQTSASNASMDSQPVLDLGDPQPQTPALEPPAADSNLGHMQGGASMRKSSRGRRQQLSMQRNSAADNCSWWQASAGLFGVTVVFGVLSSLTASSM